MMGWRDAVLSSLRAYSRRWATRVIQRPRFIAEEMASIISATGSTGATPKYTLSRILQELRDDALVDFLNPGEYLLLDAAINVEDEELPDEAIDLALRANRLRIGVVPTDTPQALVRQRRGQDRIHKLTVGYYGGCCAVCDVVEPPLLIASHIVGWAESAESRGNLSNVICLCRIHDTLFEYGYWALDASLTILKKESVVSLTILRLLEMMTCFRPPVAYPPAEYFLSRHRERTGLVA